MFQTLRPSKRLSTGECGRSQQMGRIARSWRLLHDMIEHASYMAHGYCLLWKPWLVSMHAGADILIFGAYFAIPVAIRRFLKRRPDLELRPLAVLFALFILLCGLTHLIQFVTLWVPIYEIQGWVKLATAGVSVVTAILIFPLIPKALAIPSPKQLQRVNEGLAREAASHCETLRELERARDDLEARVTRRTKELASSNARFQALVLASAQVVWTRRADGEILEDSPSWRAFTGQTIEERAGNGWLNAIHPDDRERVLGAWTEAMRTHTIYSAEYRLRHVSGGWRWTAAKAAPLLTETGEIREWVGMNTDITERKEAEQHERLLMSEVNHRAKNLLAVVQAVVRQTAGEENPKLYAERLGERIASLAASHDLLAERQWRGVVMGDLAASQLAHFGDLIGKRVRLDGPHAVLKAGASQAIGMALHELATNASKYGALSNDKGCVDVRWRLLGNGEDRRFTLEWMEQTDTPPQAPTRRGFGYRVLSDMARYALDAEVTLEYPSSGFVWKVDAPVDRVLEEAEAVCVQ
jgi:PAS domain S-box-containing protein